MSTITEDYVSFETAKLLKEKEFECEKKYITAMYNEIGTFLSLSTAADEYCDYGDFDEYDYVAPTLQMTMKWLRRVHKLYIDPEYLDFLEHGEVWVTKIVDMKTFKEFSMENTESSYEEACEVAIQYCLENLV